MRRITYVTPIKRQIIGPDKAACIERYESSGPPDGGFVVDVHVATPKASAPTCLLQYCTRQALLQVHRRGCRPSRATSRYAAATFVNTSSHLAGLLAAGAVWGQVLLAPAVGGHVRGRGAHAPAHNLQGGSLRYWSSGNADSALLEPHAQAGLHAAVQVVFKSDFTAMRIVKHASLEARRPLILPHSCGICLLDAARTGPSQSQQLYSC